MSGFIILRDIPKEIAQIDLLSFDIKGGFRGFSVVEPGFHFVSVKVDDEMHEGFWCFVNDEEAIIKQFDYTTKSFQNCDIEEERNYKELAQSGAMNHVLIPIMPMNYTAVASWNILTNYLKRDKFPFNLNHEEPMILPNSLSTEETSDWYEKKFKSRFEQAFEDSHKGNNDSFLAEFQFSFVKYIVRQKDEQALQRWLYLLQACYNAGERKIDSHPILFSELVTIMTFQFDLLDKGEFSRDSKLISIIDHFIEDMIDTGNEKLEKQAQRLIEYFEEREINIEN